MKETLPTSSRSQTPEPLQRTTAGRLTLAVTSCILLLVVSLVIYDWQLEQDQPPAFQIEVAGTARYTDNRYYLPFTITNTGRRIARTVQIIAELQLDDAPDEGGEQQIDFLSGSETKRGSFVFDHDPQGGALTIRVASYSLP